MVVTAEATVVVFTAEAVVVMSRTAGMSAPGVLCMVPMSCTAAASCTAGLWLAGAWSTAARIGSADATMAESGTGTGAAFTTGAGGRMA